MPQFEAVRKPPSTWLTIGRVPAANLARGSPLHRRAGGAETGSGLAQAAYACRSHTAASANAAAHGRSAVVQSLVSVSKTSGDS